MVPILHFPVIGLCITLLPWPRDGPCPTPSGLAITFTLAKRMLAEAKYVYLGWLFLLSSSDLSLEERAPSALAPEENPGSR